MRYINLRLTYLLTYLLTYSGFYHFPKSRVKIGLTPFPEASSSPHFPQMPSKYILEKIQMSKLKMHYEN